MGGGSSRYLHAAFHDELQTESTEVPGAHSRQIRVQAVALDGPLGQTQQVRAVHDELVGCARRHQLGVSLGMRRVPSAPASVRDPHAWSVASVEADDQVNVRVDDPEGVELNGLVEHELDRPVARQVDRRIRTVGLKQAGEDPVGEALDERLRTLAAAGGSGPNARNSSKRRSSITPQSASPSGEFAVPCATEPEYQAARAASCFIASSQTKLGRRFASASTSPRTMISRRMDSTTSSPGPRTSGGFRYVFMARVRQLGG